jgi:vitamin B12 transporter
VTYSDTTVLAGNPALQPEVGHDFDIGLSIRQPSLVGFSVDVTYFRNDLNDLIQWRQVTPNYWSPANIGKARKQGIECGLSLNPAGNIRLAWSFTYLDARNTTEGSDAFDDVLPYSPRQTNTLSLQTEWGGVRGNCSTSFRSKTIASDGLWMDAYHTTNLLLSYRIPVERASVDLKFELRNVENERYQVIKGYPMPGREVRVTLAFGYATFSGRE